VPDATLLGLRYGVHALERRTIEMGGPRARYYRLTGAGGGEMPGLTAVGARLAVQDPEPLRRWDIMVSKQHPGQPEDYIIDLAGRYPVDRIRVRLPQGNTLVKASFYSRDTDREPWKQAAPAALVYRLTIRGQEVSGSDLVLEPTPQRYWLMRVEPSGGGLGKGIPVIEFGWVPARVQFVARGSGPFRLAYGSARTKGCLQGSAELFRQFIDQRHERDPLAAAVTGPAMILGGETALRRPLTPTDTKSAILWGALVSGVLLLTWMAFRLYRHLKSEENRGDNAS
jgi:hypothetical protein